PSTAAPTSSCSATRSATASLPPTWRSATESGCAPGRCSGTRPWGGTSSTSWRGDDEVVRGVPGAQRGAAVRAPADGGQDAPAAVRGGAGRVDDRPLVLPGAAAGRLRLRPPGAGLAGAAPAGGAPPRPAGPAAAGPAVRRPPGVGAAPGRPP